VTDPHRIVIEDAEGVRVITFDRPEVRNAFDAAMYEAVTAALAGALADDGIRAVVLTGRGKAFTSGQDLREMAAIATGQAGPDAGSGFSQLLDTVVSFDKPLLAAVHGVAMGLGCTLLGHVDLVLLDPDARLRAPFAEMGVPPEAASSWLLPERMGWPAAAMVLLASEWLDAEQAVASRLAVRVCPPGMVVEETVALARRIASFAPHATRDIKRLMMAGRRADVVAAREREEAAFAALFADPATNPGAGLTSGLGS
jgi:enoyl-CoA hydratase/carnithine racemase